MSDKLRFQDENLRASDFYNEVWVHCPMCRKKAIATGLVDEVEARLFCEYCGLHQRRSRVVYFGKIRSVCVLAAHTYFDAELWLQHPFKGEVFFAYNGHHLNYLEAYIGAKLREHKDRTYFTLLEKLPRFYHSAKNRAALLKIILKLRQKAV
ncbi:hypothetical protein [Sphingobacterium sp. LRF_L2]|uniref:hypothetical protein n=1 Tax=Sphingobacterium sp. LRF_L2 TaxID=3369421 RepID=UPI003F60A0FC